MGLVPSGLQATADRYSYMPGVALSVALLPSGSCGRARRVGHEARGWQVRVLRGGWGCRLSGRRHCGRGDTRDAHVAANRLLARFDFALDPRGRTRFAQRRGALQPRRGAGRGGAARPGDCALRAGPGDRAEHTRRRAATAICSSGAARGRREPAGGKARSRRRGRALRRRGGARSAADAFAGRDSGWRSPSSGGTGNARPHLQAAIDQGVNDPAVPNALAYVLAQAGEDAAAIAILRAARQHFPRRCRISRVTWRGS